MWQCAVLAQRKANNAGKRPKMRMSLTDDVCYKGEPPDCVKAYGFLSLEGVGFSRGWSRVVVACMTWDFQKICTNYRIIWSVFIGKPHNKKIWTDLRTSNCLQNYHQRYPKNPQFPSWSSFRDSLEAGSSLWQRWKRYGTFPWDYVRCKFRIPAYIQNTRY